MGEVEKSEPPTVPQSTIVGLEAPPLEGIDVPSISRFLKERKIYEMRVEEKNKEPGVSITPTSYKASITEMVLEILIDGEYVDAECMTEIPEKMLQDCFEKHAKLEFKKLGSVEWERIVSHVRMDMKLSDAQSRVWQLVANYKEALRRAGYIEAIEKCPEITIRHIRERTRPRRLQMHMEEIIRMECRTKIHKEDFKKHTKRLAEEAQIVEQARNGNARSSFDAKAKDTDILLLTGDKTRDSLRKRILDAGSKTENSQGSSKHLPFCWNTKTFSGELQLLKHCEKTSPEERHEIWSRIRKEQRDKHILQHQRRENTTKTLVSFPF